jgi:hypothetical protein
MSKQKTSKNPQSKPDGYTLLAAGVALKWKHYRDVHYKLYDVTNDIDGYKRSMRGYQLIIKAWMQNHGQEIVAAVTEICKQEDDARIKIKFISAGYDLANDQDYTCS